MTDDSAAKAGTEGARQLLVEGQEALMSLRDKVCRLTEDIERGAPIAGQEILMAGIGLASMTKALAKEVRRHEAGVLDAGGLAHAAPLDLDDIRSRIGRRLDRIRDARGAGEVPGGVEP
jgi:hypothetical protein